MNWFKSLLRKLIFLSCLQLIVFGIVWLIIIHQLIFDKQKPPPKRGCKLLLDFLITGDWYDSSLKYFGKTTRKSEQL